MTVVSKDSFPHVLSFFDPSLLKLFATLFLYIVPSSLTSLFRCMFLTV